jgi:hypothetical protein
MRKSRNITLTVLAGIMLTACCCMGQPGGWWRRSVPDYTWYDAQGTAIPVKWKLDANGNKLLDEQGRPIPDPHVPYDKYHRAWVYNETTKEWEPQSPPAGSSSSSSHSSSWRPGGLFFFGGGGGGSGYRSSGSSSSSSRTSSPSSVSRGGFGTTSSSSSS